MANLVTYIHIHISMAKYVCYVTFYHSTICFQVPSEVIINSTLTGPENRTLAEQVIQRADNELDLILQGFDIIAFSNETAYDLNFTQVDGMEIDEYSITAVVSLTPLYSLIDQEDVTYLHDSVCECCSL